MEIALITPTRDRKEQLSLVIDCINNQTLDADVWVIADDGPEPVPQNILDKIRIPHKYIHYKSGLSKSGAANFAKALEAVTAKKYLKIDDDDYYPPTYVEHFSSLLTEENSVVGDKRWTDYRLSTGYYRERLVTDNRPEGNKSGFTGEKLKADIVAWLNNNKTNCFEDIGLNGGVYKPKHYSVKMYDFGEHSNVALKDYGVGAKGQISQHSSNSGMKPDDEAFSYFKKRLGKDWFRYDKYLGRLCPKHSRKSAEVVCEYSKKKVVDYLNTGNYRTVLVKFHHGLGDVIDFKPCFDKLCSKYPDIKFSLHTHRGQEAIFGTCSDKLEDYDIIFDIRFPCSEWSRSNYTKAENCCVNELGIEPDCLLPSLPGSWASPLVGLHFFSTCCSSVTCKESVAKRLRQQVIDAGLVPIDTHMEHTSESNKNARFSWEHCTIRDAHASCGNLLGIIGSCAGFAGVSSGNLHAALALLPEDVVLHIKTSFSADKFTRHNILELDANHYDEKIVAEWIRRIKARMARLAMHSNADQKPVPILQSPQEKTKIVFVSILQKDDVDLDSVYTTVKKNNAIWLIYIPNHIKTPDSLKQIARHDRRIIIDRSLSDVTKEATLEVAYRTRLAKADYTIKFLDLSNI